MPQIVVLGAGFGGLSVARHLCDAEPAVDITIVNRHNYMLFTPMLPEVASGSVEPRHIGQPVRAALGGRARFVLGTVTGVDVHAKRVRMSHPVTGEASELPYDQLVIALGAESSTHGVPGAEAHTLPLKTLDDAVRVRAAIVAGLEAAAATSNEGERRRLLTFTVVGGGFTGVEAAGELLAYARAASREYPSGSDDVRFVLVAGRDRLLEQLPERFGRRAAAMLKKRGVELIFDDDVAAADAGGVSLKSGRRIATSTVIWSGGVRVPQLVAELDVPHAAHHAIAVHPDLSVEERPGVWALGDCAHVPKPGGGAYPQTAQHAVREAALLARNIIASLQGWKTQPFRYHSAGMMASLGDREGLADVGGRAMIAGFPAWLLWRGYYLSRLPGAYRKLRVATDWALTLPFARDTTSMDRS